MRVVPTAAVAALAAAGALLAAGMSVRAQTPSVLNNGGFEGGTTGWFAQGGTLVSDSTSSIEGTKSAKLTSMAGTAARITSQYWVVPESAARPGYRYTLTASIRYEAPTNITGVTARLDVVNVDGTVLATAASTLGGPAAGYRVVTTSALTAPANAAFVQVTVVANATAAGASIWVDGASVAEALPLPVATPPPEPPPPPPPPPAAAEVPAADYPPPEPPRVAPRATPVPTSTPARTPTPTPTSMPTPPPLAVSTTLLNGDFAHDLVGWSVSRGRVSVEAAIPGRGASAVLRTDGAATMWVEQTIVGIAGGEWYEASALLSPARGVEAGWVRIAWYASANGAGAQTRTVDSPAVSSGGSQSAIALRAAGAERVGTGPVQAPPGTSSAKVRLLLAPHDASGASMAADDVGFARAEPFEDGPPDARAGQSTVAAPALGPLAPPPAAAPTAAPAAPSPPPTPPVASASTPSSAQAQTSALAASTPPGPAGVEDVARTAVTNTQDALRITEALPDPAQPGRDADYEWVEVTNIGVVAAALAGVTLRDNVGAVALPAVTLPPGGTILVAARLAEVGTALAYRLPGTIGNGLGNDGDRLALFAADGTLIDAFSYGEDTTYLGVMGATARILTPGGGRSIERRFGPDGAFREAVALADPSPGRAGAAGVPTARAGAPGSRAVDGASTAAGASGGTGRGDVGAWVLLLGLGGGMLGGVAAQRVAALARAARGRERPGAEGRGARAAPVAYDGHPRR